MIEIHSFRAVFDLERRIYRVDRLRLNPDGVPVRGIVYWLVLLLAALALGRMPVLGAVATILPWYVRDLAMPAMCAGALTMVRIEGRPFHLAAQASARYAFGARHLAGLRPCTSPGTRWCPPEVLVLPDGSEGFRSLSYTGPGSVVVAPAHELAEWGGTLSSRLVRRHELTLSELRGYRAPAEAQTIALKRRMRLRVS